MNPIQSLDTETQSVIVTLISKDKQEFKINRDYICISKILETSIMSDNETREFPLDIEGRILKYIVEYMEEYKGTEPKAPIPPLAQEFNEVVDTFCFNFTEKLCQERVLKEVLESVNFLNIPELLHILGCKVAHLIKGVPLDQIEKTIRDNC